jgi:hypothetical protein
MTLRVVADTKQSGPGEPGLAFLARESFGHVAFVREGKAKVRLVGVKVVDASVVVLVEDEVAREAMGQREVSLFVDHVDPVTRAGWTAEVRATALDLSHALDSVLQLEPCRSIRAPGVYPVLLIPSSVDIRHFELDPPVGVETRPSWTDGWDDW